jgi:hypothetical protein
LFPAKAAANQIWAQLSLGYWTALNDPSSREELDEAHDQRDHQQQMDQPSANVERETQQPQYEQDDENSPEHFTSPFFLIMPAGD